MSLLPLLLLPLLMYFLLIRPQQRRMRAQQELLTAIDEGDEVMTTAGIYGFVTAIEDDIVWVEIAEGVDIRVAKAALARRVAPAQTAPATAEDEVTTDGETAQVDDEG